LLKYFGHKLVMLSTLEALPVAYDLVPANTDKRQAVEGVLEVAHCCDIYGDKGFIGQDWRREGREAYPKVSYKQDYYWFCDSYGS
jgi:hypothetical protein